MNNSKNKVIWITGASSGIGEALTIEYSKSNTQLILSARRKEVLEEVRNKCQNPDTIRILPLDLVETDSMDVKVQEAVDIFGHVDVLINDGGISQRALIKDTELSVDRRVMEVNYFGTVALTKALLPHMIGRQSGQMVVVTSAVGIITTRFRSGYAASKHALHGFFDTLRIEHHEDNIGVTIVCPGFIQTEITMNALMGDGKPQQKMDEVTEKGMPVDVFARKMIKAVNRRKEEVYISGIKEKFAIYLKRYWPTLFSKMIRGAKVT